MIFELRQYRLNPGQRERLNAKVYESPTWINEMKPVNDGMIIREKIQATRLLTTPKSLIR